MATSNSGRAMHAIVSGGASGIGLHLVKHLLEREWHVIVADNRPDAWVKVSGSMDSSKTLFVETDVGSWKSNKALFEKAFEWSEGRIDFYAANAGIGPRGSLIDTADDDDEPQKPDLKCTEVCQFSALYGLKLFVHYARRTRKTPAKSANFNPKLVYTASATALYAYPATPEYCAAKHAVLGLTRSIADQVYASDNVGVNCILPGLVNTSIIPAGFAAQMPKHFITPFAMLNRAFDELIDWEGKVEQDGVSNGQDGKVKLGQAVEVGVTKLYYRQQVEYPDDIQRFLVEDADKPNGWWDKAVKAAEALKQKA